MEKSKMKRITTGVGTIFISTCLLTACGLKKEVEIHPENITTDEIEEEINDKTIDLEDKALLVTFDDYRKVDDSVYTSDDLKHIDCLIIRVDDDFDYSFINDLTNLEFLHLDDHSTGDSLNNIDLSKLGKLTSVAITMDPEIGEFNSKRYGFLKNIKSINNLILGSNKTPMVIDDDYLEDLTNVHNLVIGIGENTDIDYDDLEHLDSLTIEGPSKYLNQEDIDNLKEEGVKVYIKE